MSLDSVDQEPKTWQSVLNTIFGVADEVPLGDVELYVVKGKHEAVYYVGKLHSTGFKFCSCKDYWNRRTLHDPCKHIRKVFDNALDS